MALSFVEPDWCARDPFLQSHPVHWAFYVILGPATQWWGFEAAAILGRLLGYGSMSIGWVSLMRQLTGSRMGVVGVLLGMMVSMSFGNLSGEWLIGGIEGKVFAYGAVLGSLSALAMGDHARGAFWTGVSILFHPVVGMWHLIATAGTIAVLRFENRTQTKRQQRERFLVWDVMYRGAGIVLGLIGLIPAVYLLLRVPAATADEATRIQVYGRLAHHLNPRVFPMSAYWCYGGFLAIYFVLRFFLPRARAWRICADYVGWCVVFAAAGIAIGYFPNWFPGISLERLSPRLLKFYPFRMADLLLPWFVTTGLWWVLTDRVVRVWRLRFQGLVILSLIVVLGMSLWGHPASRSPTKLTDRESQDWIEACRWVREKTAANSLFLTTRRGWAFKWYAERAEYFSHKDAPQDAAGLVAWETRQRYLWDLFSERFSLRNLTRFRTETGTDYLLIGRGTPCELESIFENPTFAIYDLRKLSEKVASEKRLR